MTSAGELELVVEVDAGEDVEALEVEPDDSLVCERELVDVDIEIEDWILQASSRPESPSRFATPV